MFKGFKKLNILVCLLLVVFLTNLNQITTYAYPTLPTMDWSWGFTPWSSLKVPTRYWQYGGMNWSPYVSYAQQQLSSCPANVSINVSNNYSYNDTIIRISSNYWYDGEWLGKGGLNSGLTSKDMQLVASVYNVRLNSASAVTNNHSEFVLQKITLHEICHAFGLNDCESSDYLMYGYTNNNTWNELTSYEKQLLLNRYGRYN